MSSGSTHVNDPTIAGKKEPKNNFSLFFGWFKVLAFVLVVVVVVVVISLHVLLCWCSMFNHDGNFVLDCNVFWDKCIRVRALKKC